MPLASGTRLGPYEIVSPIGAGGRGLAGARYAHLDSAAARERLEREARAVSSLNHPHICTLHDIGSQDGIDFLVMECLEGESLAERLPKGPMPLEQVLTYAMQIADALEAAHRQRVVHRDLKPANIMLTKAGAKLLDFGLAKVRSTAAADETLTKALTTQGTGLGTFQYTAPEQLEGKDADARTDIFAFGAVLYEMMTGRRAFEGKSQASLIAAIFGAEPAPVSTLQPMTAPALEHVVNTCLAKEPEARWQSAQDVLLEMRWIAAGGGSQAAAPVSAAPQRQLGWIAAAAILLVTTAVFAVPVRAESVRFRRAAAGSRAGAAMERRSSTFRPIRN